MSSNHSVVHLTSVHPRFDTRIFLKECMALCRHGYSVSLVVADGKGYEEKDGVPIHDVGRFGGRLERIRRAPRQVYRKALELDADVYHLHDPELLPIGLMLKKKGKIVIFDAHEDFPKQILSKPYLNKLTRWGLSKLVSIYERRVCPQFDAVIAATPSIRDKFKAIGVKSLDINNYPLVGELSQAGVDWSEKKDHIAYVGGISRIRGILEVVRAMGFVESGARLQLAGHFGQKNVKEAARLEEGWDRVDGLGFVGREEVRDLLGKCVAGVVTFLPSPNHLDAQPNKMFEYMSAGVPVIGSHFHLWKRIIEGNECGICVDPLDPEAIAQAIDYLITHPNEAARMGRNGQRAVNEKYNWGIEEKKLLDFYNLLEKQRASC